MLDSLDFASADQENIASKFIEEHRRQIHEVYKRIQNFGFRIKETKWEFLMNVTELQSFLEKPVH